MPTDTYAGSGSGTEDHLPIGEAAKYLRRSVDTLRRWDKAGFLTPGRTFGGQRRYSRSDLDAVLALERSRTEKRTAEKRTA